MAALFCTTALFGQGTLITLTFSGVNGTAWAPPDSIRIINLAYFEIDTVLHYPDTVLNLDMRPVGTPDPLQAQEPFGISATSGTGWQAETVVKLVIPEDGVARIAVLDIHGRNLFYSFMKLSAGMHRFHVAAPVPGLYLVTAEWNGKRNTAQAVVRSGTGSGVVLEYMGCSSGITDNKAAVGSRFHYNEGDYLMMVGFSGGIQSGITDMPLASRPYQFQFATGIPCPGSPTVTIDGRAYNTVQIFSQCWMKENVDAGIVIPFNVHPSNNGILEKHCWNGQLSNCTLYGAMYEWDEVMQYNTASPQGLCAAGWHVPTLHDWRTLEGAVDSLHRFGDPVWYSVYQAGTNTATNLKSATWPPAGTWSDPFGFDGRPSIVFGPDNCIADWWSSDCYIAPFQDPRPMVFHMVQNWPVASFYDGYTTSSITVRCIRDN